MHHGQLIRKTEMYSVIVELFYICSLNAIECRVWDVITPLTSTNSRQLVVR